MPDVTTKVGAQFGVPPTAPYPQGPPPPRGDPLYTLGAPRGLLVPGNIDLSNRPVVYNADGSISTEFSTSFGDERGREVLVPTVVNGRFLTPDGTKPPEGYHDARGKYHPTPQEQEMWERARAHYHDTGEHMGIFSNPDAADEYAERVHNRQDVVKHSGMGRY